MNLPKRQLAVATPWGVLRLTIPADRPDISASLRGVMEDDLGRLAHGTPDGTSVDDHSKRTQDAGSKPESP